MYAVVLLVVRGSHADFLVIIEETLNQTILGVLVMGEEGRGDRALVGILMRRVEDRLQRLEHIAIEIADKRQQDLTEDRSACQGNTRENHSQTEVVR